MEHTWRRIEAWLQAYAPDVYFSLASGESEPQLELLENELGSTLPANFKSSYLIHDGQIINKNYGGSPCFIFTDQLYSLSKIISRWRALAPLADETEETPPTPIGAVRLVWNSRSRVPIAGDDSTHYYFLDLDPASVGHVGQVIVYYHDDNRIECVATSFREWFDAFAEELESGDYVYSKQANGLIHSIDADEEVE